MRGSANSQRGELIHLTTYEPTPMLFGPRGRLTLFTALGATLLVDVGGVPSLRLCRADI